jgi:hypothetical protein
MELPVILSKEYYKNKETSGRPLLNKLQQKLKQEEGKETCNLDLGLLTNESNLRRNKLVLEDVLRQRSNTEWLMSATTKINEAVNTYNRESKSVKKVVEMQLPSTSERNLRQASTLGNAQMAL